MDNYLNWLPSEILEIIFDELDRKSMKKLYLTRDYFNPHVRKQISCSFNKSDSDLFFNYIYQFYSIFNISKCKYDFSAVMKINNLLANNRIELLKKRMHNKDIRNLFLFLQYDKQLLELSNKIKKNMKSMDIQQKINTFLFIDYHIDKKYTIDTPCYNCFEHKGNKKGKFINWKYNNKMLQTLIVVCEKCYNDNPSVFEKLY